MVSKDGGSGEDPAKVMKIGHIEIEIMVMAS